MSPEGSSQETPPEPGDDGTPVPGGFTVLRLGPPPSPKNVNEPGHVLLKQGKAWPGLFAFSSKERELKEAGGRPRVSVWLTALTTTAQAWVLTGGNDNSRILITLSVDRIRTIFAEATSTPASPATPPLEVVWERAMRSVPTDPHNASPTTGRVTKATVGSTIFIAGRSRSRTGCGNFWPTRSRPESLLC